MLNFLVAGKNSVYTPAICWLTVFLLRLPLQTLHIHNCRVNNRNILSIGGLLMETFPSCSVEYEEKWIHAASIRLIPVQAWWISEISSQALMTLPLCDTPRLSQLWQPVPTYVGVCRLCAAVCSCTIPPRIMRLVGASCWGWGRGGVLTWQMGQPGLPALHMVARRKAG